MKRTQQDHGGKHQNNGGINQGEGDHSSDQRYRRHVREYIASGKSDVAAADAARSVEAEDAERKRTEQRDVGAAKGRRELLRFAYRALARASGWLEGLRIRMAKRLEDSRQ